MPLSQPQNKYSINELRRGVSKVDLPYFKKAYLPHYFKLESCEVHKNFENLILDIANKKDKARKIAIASPRGSAKSTYMAFLLPLYCILYGKKKNIAIIGDTATQAQEHINEIRFELTNNDMLAEDFPDVCGEGDVWTNSDIMTRNGIRVRAFGRGGAIRGTKKGAERPDLIIGDDLDNDESVMTPEQRKKSENWWFKAVSKAGYTKSTDMVVIGTILHYDCLCMKLINNPTYESLFYKSVINWSESNRWDEWRDILHDKANGGEGRAKEYYERNAGEMTQGTEVLWEQNESYYDLMFLRESEGEASFNSEKQNEPIDPNDCRFRDFSFYDAAPDIVEYYGSCDPSLGKDHGDYTAIIVLGKDAHGWLYVIDAIVERLQPNIIMDKILDLPYQFEKFGIEKVAFQEFFMQVVEEESRKRNKYMPILGIKNEGTKKEVRIDRLQPLIMNGTIKFNKRHYRLLEQLKYYPMADHDDGCFVAGTMVRTNKGNKRIETIKKGDYVLTRTGYQPVLHAGCTGVKDVCNNLGLTGTLNHPVITKEGVIPLTSVSASDILYTWNEKLLSIEEKSFTETQRQSADNIAFIFGRIQKIRNALLRCIVRCGLILMERFQKGITYTTKTATLLITRLRTLRLYLHQIIQKCTQIKQSISVGQEKQSKLRNSTQKNGTPHQKADNGIQNMDNVLQMRASSKREPVSNVVQSSPQETIGKSNFAISTAGKSTVIGKQKVYNISVANNHEYFANNILVHNCDALEMAVRLAIRGQMQMN